MVDTHGRARITDFGLARDQGATEETSVTAGGTARWTAPEILQGREGPSKKADVFSFAMVMVEVGLAARWSVRVRSPTHHLHASMKTFTGSAPFDLHLSITVALAIMRGDRPSRPIHPALSHGLWELMEHCWSQEPDSRPDMPEVLQVLHNPSAPLSLHNRTFSNLTILLCAVRPLNPPHMGPALIPIKGRFPHPPPRTRTILDSTGSRGEGVCPFCPRSNPPPFNDPATA